MKDLTANQGSCSRGSEAIARITPYQPHQPTSPGNPRAPRRQPR